jgi:hypothetical protein
VLVDKDPGLDSQAEECGVRIPSPLQVTWLAGVNSLTLLSAHPEYVAELDVE